MQGLYTPQGHHRHGCDSLQLVQVEIFLDRPTDRQTDIVVYREVTLTKKVDKI